MIAHILLAITNFITQTISTFGYTGVALLMAIESAAIPLPSEVVMPFAGYLVDSGQFRLLNLALAGAIGSTFGSLLTYALGYYGGRPLVMKYGHWIFVSETELLWTEKFFQRFGNWSVFLGRVLPVARTFISIPAGMAKIPVGPFALAAFVGSFIWCYVLAWLGLKLGENWPVLETYFRKFDVVIAAAVVLVVIFWIVRHIKNRI